MNGRSGTMSPVSVDGSDWSGINQYQGASNKSEPPFSPTFSTRSNLATPPTSGGPPVPPAPNSAGLPPPRPSDPGNPSPPSSVAARSSDGTLGDQQNARRYKHMEDVLLQHYAALKRFLQAPYRDDRGNPKSNKARDKLLRLSPTQFHELSTDVYDELLRRQQAMPSPGRPGPPRPDVPPFLPPRQDFHEKRNQARQKLASLQHPRFKDLATDVFCELERRFPQFAARDMSRRGSPAPSFRSTTSRGGPPNGFPPNGYGPRPGSNGYPPNGPPGARRSQSRGPPPGRMGRGYPSGGPPPGPMNGFPPRQGSLGGPPPGVNGEGPLPKSFQSNTIVPNKSTMVEDDDDAAGVEDDYDARSDAFALDGVLQSRRGTTTTLGEGERKLLAEAQSQVSVLLDKVDKLEELVKSKDEELLRLRDQDKSEVSNSERQEWENFKLDLESKISKAEDLNSSLQLELDKVRTEQDTMEQDLRRQIDEASRQSSGDVELQARFNDLESKHRILQAELHEQQHVTEEVRREASNFLMEMKILSEQSQSNWEREERLSGEVQRLEEEVKEWKSRYAKTKTQLRDLRTSSVGISGSLPDIGTHARQNELMQPDGLVKDVHVTKFQISIDELLRIARFDESRLVLDQMKSVVLAVHHIIQDVDVAQNQGDEMAQLRTKAKGKVSATANNLITASKNFAHSSGLSPVSLLDAAASHLSTAVVELIRFAKIRPTPADELEEDDEDNLAPMQSPDYFSVPPSQDRYSHNESIYSAISSPSVESRGQTQFHHLPNGILNGVSTGVKLNYGMQPEDDEIRDLKLYLEDQTDGLVHSIQALVASIRAEENLATIRSHISSISSVVTNVVSSTERSLNRSGASATLRQRSGPILQSLDNCRDRLMETAAAGEDASNSDHLRDVTSKLPPIAFELARETKELIQRLDPVEHDGGEEDDFR